VTLDTDSRDVMLRVILQLRGLVLGGDYIHARLKSSTLHQAPVIDPVVLAATQSALSKKKKKRGSRQKKKKQPQVEVNLERTSLAPSSTPKSTPTTGKNVKKNNPENKKKNVKKQQKPKKPTPQPSSLAQDEFPTLVDKVVECTPIPETAIPQVQAEEEAASKSEVSDFDDATKTFQIALSDGGSTATTASSSMESAPKKVLSGYAAAVLKPAADPTKTTRPQPETAKLEASPKTTSPVPAATVAPAINSSAVVFTPPVWGRGRSFAEAARSAA